MSKHPSTRSSIQSFLTHSRRAVAWRTGRKTGWTWPARRRTPTSRARRRPAGPASGDSLSRRATWRRHQPRRQNKRSPRRVPRPSTSAQLLPIPRFASHSSPTQIPALFFHRLLFYLFYTVSRNYNGWVGWRRVFFNFGHSQKLGRDCASGPFKKSMQPRVSGRQPHRLQRPSWPGQCPRCGPRRRT